MGSFSLSVRPETPFGEDFFQTLPFVVAGAGIEHCLNWLMRPVGSPEPITRKFIVHRVGFEPTTTRVSDEDSYQTELPMHIMADCNV